jgi:hypothetical protein
LNPFRCPHSSFLLQLYPPLSPSNPLPDHF